MRYLGIALGNAIALGLCAAFGTLIPPLFSGELLTMVRTGSGKVILLGVFICLAGITLSGRAGISREKTLADEQRKKTPGEFNFSKGIFVAILAGVMSASMAYGFAAGKPIAQIALQNNAPPHWQNLPVLIVVLFGGFVTNCIFCVRLIVKNKQAASFFAREIGGKKINPLANYSLCALAGLTWYMQFFFYGIGTTKMGPFDFSSWTLHMASIIIFATLWGIFLREWKGTSGGAKLWLTAGLVLLILSMVVVGIGNKMAAAA
jgi:L-rhamnose-H+ transport protein